MSRRLRLPPLAVLPLLLIPAVLAVVVWQLRDDSESSVFSNVQPPPEADYYLRDAVVSMMGDDGQLLYRVTASDVLHFPDQSVRLHDVRVDYLDGPWQLVAKGGYMPPDESRLDLQGAVDMQGSLRSGEPVRVQMPMVSIHIHERRIETSARVTMESGRISATAVGMRTDLEGRELKLLADVRVNYAP